MKKEKQIKALLKKFVLNECTDKEIQKVVKYFSERSESDDFLTVEEVLQLIGDMPEMDVASADRIYYKIISVSENKRSIVPVNSSRNTFSWRYAAAVVVICILAGGYFISQNWFLAKSTEETVSQIGDKLIAPEEVITLTRENGEYEIINPDGSLSVTDAQGNVIGTQNKGVLTYEGGDKIEKLAHNTLTIPYGKRFEVVLSDGTSVHLNAGSSLRYPVKFLESEHSREVFVTGEAFFDVTRDAKHPFIVNTGDVNVRVLGTRFNVSSYPEDEATDVVLVEGSVHLQNQGQESFSENETILEPGEKGRYDKRDHMISKKQVVTSVYTAWMDGELVFRNMAFEDILKKLERHYNITIMNQNKTIAKEKFNASFGDEPVKKVLDNLSTIYGIEFTMEGKQVTVL